MIGYGTPLNLPCQRWTSVPHTSERTVRTSAAPGGRSGRGNSRSSIGSRGAIITAARTRSLNDVYVILERMLIQSAAVLCLAASLAPASQARYQPQKARRHFITLYAERQFVQGSGF